MKAGRELDAWIAENVMEWTPLSGDAIPETIGCVQDDEFFGMEDKGCE